VTVRGSVFRFRVALRGVVPPIWREIEVPASYSLWDLHVAIQDAMGWEDRHLHMFVFERDLSGQKAEVGIPDPDLPPGTDSVLAGWELRIAEYFSESGSTAEYKYDFGDGWQHDVTLAAIVPRAKGARYPRCTGGERACPPEDCGGIGGYARLLDIIFDPRHEEFETMRAWIGRRFEPEAFSPAAVRFDNPKRRWKRAFESDE